MQYFVRFELISQQTGLNFSVWAVICFTFNNLLRRRASAWWGKYTMTLSAALDSGLAFGVVVVFFGFVYPGWTSGLKWWGTEVFKQVSFVFFPSSRQVLYRLTSADSPRAATGKPVPIKPLLRANALVRENLVLRVSFRYEAEALSMTYPLNPNACILKFPTQLHRGLINSQCRMGWARHLHHVFISHALP